MKQIENIVSNKKNTFIVLPSNMDLSKHYIKLFYLEIVHLHNMAGCENKVPSESDKQNDVFFVLDSLSLHILKIKTIEELKKTM